MSDVNTAVNSVNSRLEQENALLNRKLQRHVDEISRRKKAASTMEKELETLRASVTGLEKERDEFKSKAEAGPQGAAEELTKLRAEVATFKHKEAWSEVMKDKDLGLIEGISYEKLSKLVGYTPEGDPDPKKIKELLAAEKEKGELPFLFSAPQGETKGTTNPQGLAGTGNGKVQVQAAEPGLGAGRTAPQHAPVDDYKQTAAILAEKGRPIGVRKI